MQDHGKETVVPEKLSHSNSCFAIPLLYPLSQQLRDTFDRG
jgi:hypothetical protein